MVEKLSAEESFAELKDIVRRYRLGAAHPEARGRLSREEALSRLQKLRFTVGEGLRLLRPESRR